MVVPGSYNSNKAGESIYKPGNLSIKLLQGCTCIINPTLIQHLPACLHCATWLLNCIKAAIKWILTAGEKSNKGVVNED